ncbi:hypothetical protein Tco_0042697 [Tanacetum coccineum]
MYSSIPSYVFTINFSIGSSSYPSVLIKARSSFLVGVELECVVLLEIGGGICKTVQSRSVLRVNCCESWLNWNVLLLELHVIVVQNCCRYMTGTVAVKEFGLYSLWCLRILTASFRNKSVMFESEETRWLFFVILILLALGTSCSSDVTVACRFALDMIDSENKNQS